MSVYYKFKSALSFDTIQFDDIHISLADFKKAIIDQKQFGKSTNFDLEVTNAETNEAYTDETVLIPKNSSLIVVRVPLPGQKKNWEPLDNSSSFATGTSSNLDFHQADIGRKLIQSVDLSVANASEEDKIKAMMFQSTVDYDPSNYVKLRGGNQYGEVPDSYICHKCQQRGHWIKDCPMNVGEIKKSTGIPQCFMTPVGPSVPGALMTPAGSFAIPIIDYNAYKEGKKEKPFNADEDQETNYKPDIPDDLTCSICHDLLMDVVMMPCCGTSFCDECIRNALLESEDNVCPDCKEKEVSPETLIPNRFLRTRVNKFCSQTGYKGSQNKVTTVPPTDNPPVTTEPTPTVTEEVCEQNDVAEVGRAISVLGSNKIESVVSLRENAQKTPTVHIEHRPPTGRPKNNLQTEDKSPINVTEHKRIVRISEKNEDNRFSPVLQENKHNSPHQIVPGTDYVSAVSPHLNMPPFNPQHVPSIITGPTGPHFAGPPPTMMQPLTYGHLPGMNPMIPPTHIQHPNVPFPGHQPGTYPFPPGGVRGSRDMYRMRHMHPMRQPLLANEFENKENYDSLLHAFEKRLQEKEKQDGIRRAKRRSRSRSHSRLRSTSRTRSRSHSRSKSSNRKDSPHRKKKLSRSPSQKIKRSKSRSRSHSPLRKVTRLRTRSRSLSPARSPRRSRSHTPITSKKKRTASPSPVKIKKKRRSGTVSRSRSRSLNTRHRPRRGKLTRSRSWSRSRSYNRSLSRGRSYSRSRSPTPRHERFSPRYENRPRPYFRGNNMRNPRHRYGDFRNGSPPPFHNDGHMFQDSNYRTAPRGRGRGNYRYQRGGKYDNQFHDNNFQFNSNRYSGNTERYSGNSERYSGITERYSGNTERYSGTMEKYSGNTERRNDNRNNRGFYTGHTAAIHEVHIEKPIPYYETHQFTQYPPPAFVEPIPPGTGDVLLENFDNNTYLDYDRNKTDLDYDRNKPDLDYGRNKTDFINNENLRELPFRDWEKPKDREIYQKSKENDYDHQKHYLHHYHHRDYEYRDRSKSKEKYHRRSRSRTRDYYDNVSAVSEERQKASSSEIEKPKKKKESEHKEKKEKNKRKKKKDGETKKKKKSKKPSKEITNENKNISEENIESNAEMTTQVKEDVPEPEIKTDVQETTKEEIIEQVQIEEEIPVDEKPEIMLASVPEKSKWEIDEELIVMDEKNVMKSEIESPPKVTNEILKRAENVLFQKGGKLPRPDIVTQELNVVREARRTGHTIQVTVPAKTDSTVEVKSSSHVDKAVKLSGQSKSSSGDEHVRISAKERLGAKVDSKKSDHVLKSTVVDPTIKLHSLKSTVVEKSSHHHKDKTKKDSHDRNHLKSKEHKDSGDDVSKSKDKAHNFDVPKAKKNYNAEKGKDTVEQHKSKSDLLSKIKDTKPKTEELSRGERKQGALDVDNFEPDYDLTTGSESEHGLNGGSMKNPVQAKELTIEQPKQILDKKVSEPASETESTVESSSDTSSESSREHKRKKKKKAKKKKRKHAKKRKDYSSNTESEESSESDTDVEVKTKHKKKHKHKSKKSKSSRKKKKSKH